MVSREHSSCGPAALLLCGLLLSLQPTPIAADNVDVKIENGVYQNIVLAVKPETAEPTYGTEFLNEIKAFLKAGSDALNYATDGGASFGNVSLILPKSWDSSKFGHVEPYKPSLTIDSADILLHDIPDTLPDTLQVGQCGVPGIQIRVPISFLTLTSEEEKTYGAPGLILAHEWAHYRYGVQDEHGFSDDDVYEASFQDDNEPYHVTSCTTGPLRGNWSTDCQSSQPSRCFPNTDTEEACYFCINNSGNTAQLTQASLGYLPALSLGKFCNASTHNREGPSPQNLLCGRRSVSELIALHPDSDSMVTHSPADTINIIVYREPLPRVLLLLDTPPTKGQVLDYNSLLGYLRDPITKYSDLQVAMASYRVNNDSSTELYNTRDFAVIPEDEYMTQLSPKLPAAADRTAVPELSEVLQLVLKELATDPYSPGTIVVMPLSNELLQAANLDQTTAELLHERRMQPLLLFPEASPDLELVGSFLQHSGSRFLRRNSTDDDKPEYASILAQAEVQAALDNGFQNTHAILKKDAVLIDNAGEFAGQLSFQSSVVEHQLAVITSNGPVSDLKLYSKKHGTFKDCHELETCIYTQDSIFFMQSFKYFTSPGEEWSLKVENTGPSANVKITWSTVNFVEVPEEMTVQVWSSEGRGPVASIFQNAHLVLYVSVMNFDFQVLRSRITVLADVQLSEPGAAATPTLLEGLELLDDGEGADIRRDDSVYSAFLAEGYVLDIGTNVTVKRIYIESDNVGLLASWKRQQNEQQQQPAGARAGASSQLLTMNPEEGQCCGSFVQDPNIPLNHRINGFFLYLWNSFETFQLTRKVDTTVTTTTTTTTTAAPPSASSGASSSEPTTTTTAAPSSAAPTGASSSEPPTTDTTTTTPAVPTTTVITTTDAGVVAVPGAVTQLLPAMLAAILCVRAAILD